MLHFTHHSYDETFPQSVSEEWIAPLPEDECNQLIGPVPPPLNQEMREELNAVLPESPHQSQLEGKDQGNAPTETRQKASKEVRIYNSIPDNSSDFMLASCVGVGVMSLKHIYINFFVCLKNLALDVSDTSGALVERRLSRSFSQTSEQVRMFFLIIIIIVF